MGREKEAPSDGKRRQSERKKVGRDPDPVLGGWTELCGETAGEPSTDGENGDEPETDEKVRGESGAEITHRCLSPRRLAPQRR